LIIHHGGTKYMDRVAGTPTVTPGFDATSQSKRRTS
jgi:hypothetical protein